MSEDPRQTMSALLDGECSPRETRRAVKELLNDDELSARWERYNLIGRAVRAEAINPQAREMAERVREALDGGVVRMADRVRRPSRTPVHTRLFTPLATGLAAGVALLAVVIGPTALVDIDSPLSGDQGSGTAMRPFGAMGAGTDAMATQAASTLRWQQTDPMVRAKLDSLVVSHQERLSEAGIPGFVSYAAVVGYEGRP